MQRNIHLWIVLLCLSISSTSWIVEGEHKFVDDLPPIPITSTPKLASPSASPSKHSDQPPHENIYQLNSVEVGLRNSRCKNDWNPYEYREVYWTPNREGSLDTHYASNKGNLEDPFLSAKPIFPEKPHTWTLDCDSGLADVDCFTNARSVCDTFCVQQCYKHFNGHKTQEEFIEILKSVGSDGCVYRIQEVIALEATVCRTELNYQFKGQAAAPLEQTATVYLFEPNWAVVPLANYRRLRKAALTLPLAGKYVSNSSLPSDFGNFIKATDLFDVKNCIITPSRLPYFYSDLLMDKIYRTHFGAVYSWEPSEDGKGEGGTYTNDISYLLRPSALATLGGLPKQFIVWWPGKQPLLAGENGTFSSHASLKLIFQLPPSRYFSGEGMFTIEDEHCRIPRPDF